MSLSKKSKIFIIALAVIVVGGVAGYFYLYQAHETTEDMEVVFTGTAEALESVLDEKIKIWTPSDGEGKAEKGNKAIELSGVITEKGEETISIGGKFFFQFPKETNIDNLAEGQKIKVKGRIIGYDELLEELKFDKTIILKK